MRLTNFSCQTLSLCTALEMLGFGPCHHPARLGVDTNYWSKIAKAAQGAISLLQQQNLLSDSLVIPFKDVENVSPEILADIFGGYVSALDSTTAVLAKPLYEAYPDAKFILVSDVQIVEVVSHEPSFLSIDG